MRNRKPKQTAIKIDAAIMAQLRELKDAGGQTINWMVAQALQQYIAQRKEQSCTGTR